MSLHERYFSKITELYCSSFYCISKQTPRLLCRETSPSAYDFQDFSSGYLPLPYSPFTVIVKDLSI